MPKTLLAVRGLTKSFGANHVLQGIDLDVHESEVIVIIGPSGSGKTTFLRSLNCLAMADAGTLSLNETMIDVATAKRPAILAYQRQTGMVFQNYALFANHSAKENIAMPLRLTQHASVAEADRIATELLGQVGLAERADHFPSQLSGGQQQRIGIARMLALKPAVMLFDEPTSALDPELVRQTLTLLQKIAKTGATMVLVTHEMQFAYDVADRVVFMEGGRIVEQGTPQAIFDHPQNPRTQAFLARFARRMVG
jgi:L-cystine transport system ATP-binding protein